MQYRRIIGFGGRAGRRTDEGFTRGKLDAVRRRTIESAGSAVVDLGAGRGDEGLGLLDRRHGDDGRRVDHGRLIAVHLLGGEDRRGAGKQAGFSLGLARLGGDFKLLVEDDIGGFLALADLGAGLGPLAVSAPCAGTVAGGLGIGQRATTLTPR